MTKSIQFDCHYCLNPVTALKEQCGREIACPNCKTPLIVPSQPIDAQLFDDIFESLHPEETNSKLILADFSRDNPDPSLHNQPRPETPIIRLLVEGQDLIAGEHVDESKKRSEPTIEDLFDELNSRSTVENVQSRSSGTDEALQIEGLDFTDPHEGLTVVCKICDSRVHLAADQQGKEVECPVCFSKLRIEPSKIVVPKRVQRAQRDTQMTYESAANKLDAEEELSLIPIEASFSPSQPPPLLKPAISSKPMMANPSPTTNSSPVTKPGSRVASRDSGSKSPDRNRDSRDSTEARSAVFSHPPDKDQETTAKPSRRERYEAARRKMETLGKPRRPSPKPLADDGGNPYASDTEADSSVPTSVGLGDAVAMLKNASVIWRALLATFMIGFGSGMMHFLRNKREGVDVEIGERIVGFLLWFGLAAIPYLAGVSFLWLISGFIFRGSAKGEETVSSWGIASFHEFRMTFLMFGFSFLVAGILFAPFPYLYPLVLPLRFLLAPAFLYSAWRVENPFAIFSGRIFQSLQNKANEWGLYCYPIFGLALLGFIAHSLMMVSWPLLSLPASLLGALLATIVTIAFAALTGKHFVRLNNELPKRPGLSR